MSAHAVKSPGREHPDCRPTPASFIPPPKGT
jgi:hypothetical protein